jgi:hypothetical protein
MANKEQDLLNSIAKSLGVSKLVTKMSLQDQSVISESTCKRLTEIVLCFADKYNKNCLTSSDVQTMTVINSLQFGITTATNCGSAEDAALLASKLEEVVSLKCC